MVGGHVAQLIHPGGDVGALGIVVVGLLDGVEDARFTARIVAHPSDVLPVAPVGGDVVVDEHALVPLGAETPVKGEVLGEKGSDILACPVRRVARVVEFALAGVNESHARGAIEEALPPLAHLRRREARLGTRSSREMPGAHGARVAAEAGGREESRAKLASAETHVVAPEQFKADRRRALVGTVAIAGDSLPVVVRAVLKGEQLGVDLARSDATESEKG